MSTLRTLFRSLDAHTLWAFNADRALSRRG